MEQCLFFQKKAGWDKTGSNTLSCCWQSLYIVLNLCMLSICPLRIRLLKSENWTLVSGPGSSASNAGGMIPVLGPLDGDMAAMNNITILQYTSTPLCLYTTGFQKCFKYSIQILLCHLHIRQSKNNGPSSGRHLVISKASMMFVEIPEVMT